MEYQKLFKVIHESFFTRIAVEIRQLGIMGFIFNLVWQIIKLVINWFNRPNISFTFEQMLSKDAENQYCHYRLNTSANNLPGWFFRLGVLNVGKTPVLRSDIRVERIVQKDNDKIIIDTPFFLHWANENSDESRNLYSKSSVFIDLVYTITGIEKLFIHHKSKHTGAGIKSFLEKGSYIFELKLVGESINPIMQKVHVSFNGAVDGVTIELIK